MKRETVKEEREREREVYNELWIDIVYIVIQLRNF